MLGACEGVTKRLVDESVKREKTQYSQTTQDVRFRFCDQIDIVIVIGKEG